MDTRRVDVLLEFPAMPGPLRIGVSPRQLLFLDSVGDRRLGPEGIVIYRSRPGRPANLSPWEESPDSPAPV